MLSKRKKRVPEAFSSFKLGWGDAAAGKPRRRSFMDPATPPKVRIAYERGHSQGFDDRKRADRSACRLYPYKEDGQET
jgi:hypothetical protein